MYSPASLQGKSLEDQPIQHERGFAFVSKKEKACTYLTIDGEHTDGCEDMMYKWKSDGYRDAADGR